MGAARSECTVISSTTSTASARARRITLALPITLISSPLSENGPTWVLLPYSSGGQTSILRLLEAMCLIAGLSEQLLVQLPFIAAQGQRRYDGPHRGGVRLVTI